MNQHFYKSSKDRILDGVCSGIGDYFNINPALIRLAFIALSAFKGIGIVIYLVLSYILPYSPIEFKKENPVE